MFYAHKNRRRFNSGASSKPSAQITKAASETLEFRQMLTAITVAPEAAVSVTMETEMTDAVFAELQDTTFLTEDAPTSEQQLDVSNIGSSGDDGVFLENAHSEGSHAANMAALPVPPSIPGGLGRDMAGAGARTVRHAERLFDNINDLREEKRKCEEVVEQLQGEVNAAQSAVDQATSEQADRQNAFDQADKDVTDAQSELNDLNNKLKDLNNDLNNARRARRGYAQAISAAGRLSKQARRRGDHAAADSLARQVQVNFDKYQEKVNEIRTLKEKIKTVRQDIKAARTKVRDARTARNAANRELNQAKRATAAAQRNLDRAEKRLETAKDKCKKICQTLEDKEREYLGTDSTNGAHADAVDAVQQGKQKQLDRLKKAADAKQQRANAAEAARLRSTNFIQPLELKGMRGKSVSDHTPCDIAVLIGQQGNSSAPSNPTGQQLAQAAAILAMKSKGTSEGLKAVGNALLGAAWNQLTNLVPVLAALDKLYSKVEGMKNFLEDFKNGNIKHQRFHWFPQWGSVQTDIWFNCKTGQYISKTTVVFYVPKGSNHMGGAGRHGLFVPPHLGGKSFTVTQFGTVK